MAKKKATPKKKAIAKSSRTASAKAQRKAEPTGQSMSKPAAQPVAAGMYFYQHEIESNTSNAPLVVDIPIGEGRGEQPVRPSFVGFSAEMGEEHWPDQFAFRIIALAETTVRVMISRVDKNSQEQGWGAKLVVHVCVVAA